MGESALVLEDEQEEFFAPANFDAIDTLIGEYKRELSNIDRVADFMVSGDMQAAVRYFFDGNRQKFDRYAPDPSDVFARDIAVPALNAYYWQRALQLTDVRDFMPDACRQEWDDSIREMKTPDFEEETVRATLGALLNQRMDFLAEMVDGIFQGLSGEHVTNQPEGFGKRMIITYVLDWMGASNRRSGLIHDLRSVIAKFMGRDHPTYGSTRRDLENFRRMGTGVWYPWDGGALRIRVYLNGNAHLEVHPSLSWRLNQILTYLYPMAIPSKHRTKPKRKPKVKDFQLIERPVPFAVLKHIGSAEFHKKGSVLIPGRYDQEEVRYTHHTLRIRSYVSDWNDADKHIKREVAKVLTYIGGTQAQKDDAEFLFDYDATDVIAELLSSGCVPDVRSHQYFPTPLRVAFDAMELAEIGENDTCLEPSAGQGALADAILGCDDITCVEINRINCKVLEQKGYYVEQADFLDWETGMKFSRILMNPPYSEGRWQRHLEKAAELLTSDGRLVAILPASAKDKDILPGWKVSWSDVYENEFYGTSVNVVIMVAER